MANNNDVKIFIAYAREDVEILNKLRTNLVVLEKTQGVDVWYDGEIEAGTDWAQSIKDHLHSADIILLLISQNFIASDYCYGTEMTQALVLHDTGKVKVIPVIARECLWQDTPFAKLQVLPTDGKPIMSTSWENPNRPYVIVAEAVKNHVNKMRGVVSEDSPAYIPVTESGSSSSLLQNNLFRYGLPAVLLVLLGVFLGPKLMNSSTPEESENGLQSELDVSGSQGEDAGLLASLTEAEIGQKLFDQFFDAGLEHYLADDFNKAKEQFSAALTLGQGVGIEVSNVAQWIKRCENKITEIRNAKSAEQIEDAYNDSMSKGDAAYKKKNYKRALDHYYKAQEYKETNAVKSKINKCLNKIKAGDSSGDSPGNPTRVDPRFQEYLKNQNIQTVPAVSPKKVDASTLKIMKTLSKEDYKNLERSGVVPNN